MSGHTSLVIFILLTLLLPMMFWALNKLLAPKRSSRKKRLSFECGQEPFEWRASPFPFEYFPYAIIYVAYAVLAIVVFLASITLIDAPEAAPRVIILLAVVSASSLYLAANLKRLSQRL
ncbi:MAG TPA: hypothetical protein EYH45_01760 [Candidatus Caldiarchaeum subterraneum]|uniref:NADH-quinone oxidoreductase subunit A n=1 Tax=Caldiarchaeum subterraneum TaxID=311458 RepID=A0A832ZVN4_CALS0|nr:hypothetical protein [Aigarchaeota archaeon]HIQ29271.1 hypothetical protein [Candidatus Caldarchaeum subterraneum]